MASRWKTLVLALGFVGPLASCSVESEKTPFRTEFDRQIEILAQFGKLDIVEAKDVSDVKFHPILNATAMLVRGCQQERKDCEAMCSCPDDACSIVGVCPVDQAGSASSYCSRPMRLHDDPRRECPTAPLRSNPTLGQDSGTGLPLTRTAVLTAFHVLYGSAPEDWRVVFNWRVKRSGPNDPPDVYRVNHILACGAKGAPVDDWVILGVSEPMPERVVLPQFSNGSTPAAAFDRGARFISAAYPHGTTLKFASDGRFLRPADDADSVFFHTLDTLRGFSGAPIFDADRLELVGINVDGGNETFADTSHMCTPEGCCDYPRELMPQASCITLPICSNDGCCDGDRDSTGIRGSRMFAAIADVRAGQEDPNADRACREILKNK